MLVADQADVGRADETGGARDQQSHSVPPPLLVGRDSRPGRPARWADWIACSRWLTSAEKAGRGAGRPNSSVVIESTLHSTLACSKISRANSYQEHWPAAAMWWMPNSIPSIRRTIP